MAENSCLFLSYNELQNLIRWTTQMPQHQDLNLPQMILAAAGAGALTSFALSVHSPLLLGESSEEESEAYDRSISALPHRVFLEPLSSW